jgi:hypothetical protein
MQHRSSLQGTHERGVDVGRFNLNKGETRFKDDKSKDLVDDANFLDLLDEVSVLNLLDESHRILKGRDDETAIRRQKIELGLRFWGHKEVALKREKHVRNDPGAIMIRNATYNRFKEGPRDNVYKKVYIRVRVVL